ncbi:hypothetical protein C8R44DRAFT_725464 [Mycena epipterygia]|nr:hypothetical protein C8R44DRAFT_725464 [Mycena epipterygia]
MTGQSKMLRPSGSRSNAAQSTRGRSATTRNTTEKENDATDTNARRTTNQVKAVEHPAADDGDSDSEDDDDEYSLPNAINGGEDSELDDADGDADEEEDGGSTVRGRARRVSEKQAQRGKSLLSVSYEEKAEAEARKAQKALKAAKAVRKKAGVVEEDMRGPIQDDLFTSHTVASRPTITKNLAQRTSKVPAPPKLDLRDARRRDRHGHNSDEGSSRRNHRSVSSDDTWHTFRGRSPSPARIPVRAPIRNINGGIVPDSVTLHLVHDASRDDQHSAPCRRPRSPRPRSLSPDRRLSSPDIGDKRPRTPSEDVDELRSTQSPRINTSGQRPRAKDLDDRTREYVMYTIDIYRCNISALQGFPDGPTETRMTKDAWSLTCNDLGEKLPLTPAIAKLISSRGPQLCGELKTKVKPIVNLVYGFKTGQNKKTIAFNRKLAEDLKEGSAFAFRNVKEKKGLYKNPIFQMVFNAMWFANRKDEGVTHPELFNPAPVPAFALTLAAVENSIDEHLTGIRMDVPFTANEYRRVYESHLTALEQFETHTEKYQILDKILTRIHDVGRFHSGAQPITATTTATFSAEVLDAAIKEYKDANTTEDGTDAEV